MSENGDVECGSRPPMKIEQQEKNTLSLKTKFFYSFGHIFNDLNCAMWFSYTLLYFQYRFSGALIGLIILLGQISDAVSSPVIGYLADREFDCFLIKSLGRRKFWYAFGTVLQAITLPLFFNECLLFPDSSQTLQLIYYSVLAIVWQGSWAAVQVCAFIKYFRFRFYFNNFFFFLLLPIKNSGQSCFADKLSH